MHHHGRDKNPRMLDTRLPKCILFPGLKKKSRMFRGYLLPNMSCAMFVTGFSVMRVIRSDTSVWRREGNQSMNNKEHCIVPNVLNGLGTMG